MNNLKILSYSYVFLTTKNKTSKPNVMILKYELPEFFSE